MVCQTCQSPTWWQSIYSPEMRCVACEPPPARNIIGYIWQVAKSGSGQWRLDAWTASGKLVLEDTTPETIQTRLADLREATAGEEISDDLAEQIWRNFESMEKALSGASENTSA